MQRNEDEGSPSIRPAIPMPLRRSVLVEAGHRCAIPTCKQIPVEIAHIDPWNECKTHEFENLIALCPTCHTRYDKGDIDRLSMKRYKANLGVMNSRYNEQERRLLAAFAEQPDGFFIFGPDAEFTFMYLLKDSLVRKAPGIHGHSTVMRFTVAGRSNQNSYFLTEQGREWIRNWKEGELK